MANGFNVPLNDGIYISAVLMIIQTGSGSLCAATLGGKGPFNAVIGSRRDIKIVGIHRDKMSSIAVQYTFGFMVLMQQSTRWEHRGWYTATEWLDGVGELRLTG